MGCLLHEEPRLEEESFVRLTPAGTFAQAYEWSRVLLDAGLRCRIICERLISSTSRAPIRAMLPVIHVHPDDLWRARAILKELSRRVVLPYAAAN